ncbi:hypothetical protein [Enterococcus phage vB_EfaS_Ef2.2]|nr:hypothetical protein [Enterococcus phage vB_EfaS_Ef2.2]
MERLMVVTKIISDPSVKLFEPQSIELVDNFYEDDFPEGDMLKEAVSESLWNAAYEILHTQMAMADKVIALVTVYNASTLEESTYAYEAIQDSVNKAICGGAVEDVKWKQFVGSLDSDYKEFFEKV